VARRPLLDHLVRGGQQSFRDHEPQLLGGGGVDGQLDLCGPLHGQVRGLLAPEDAPDIVPGQPVHLEAVGPVTGETARQRGYGPLVFLRNFPIPCFTVVLY
jgi:hypothetical protein